MPFCPKRPVMIKGLRLKNWKTHLDSELVFNRGVNGLLGVMGSGKSSVLDAVCFALYGTFPALQQRRIKLDDVLMRFPTLKRQASVELELHRDGASYTIRRVVDKGKGTSLSELRKNNRLVESPNAQRVTEKVEAILGVDFDLFSQIIYCEQNRLDQFLQIPKGQRMKKIDELLKIERFGVARANAVKLGNRLKSRAEARQEDVKRLAESLKGIDVKKIKADVKRMASEISGLDKDLAEARKKRDGLYKSVEKLRRRKEGFEKLREKEITIRARLEQAEKELKARGGIDELKGFSAEFLSTQTRRLNNALENQLSIEKKGAVLEEKVDSLKRSGADADEELKEKRKGLKKVGELEVLKKSKAEAEEALARHTGIVSEAEASLEAVSKSLAELRKAGASCPVCETPLPADKKSELSKGREKEAEGLSSKLASSKRDRAEAKARLEALQRKHDALMRYAGAADEVARLEDKKKGLSKELDAAKKELEEAKRSFSRKKVEKLKEEITRFEKLEDSLRFLQAKRDSEDEMKQLAIDMDELGFRPEELESGEEAFRAEDKRVDVLAERLSSAAAVLSEKREYLKRVEKEVDMLKALEAEAGQLSVIVGELEKFRLVLDETQVVLRERFVKAVNQSMTSFWEPLYPYEDYRGIRLAVDNDYVLQLQNADGEWVNAEGAVSGGERMMAVLALRLALAVVLTPKVRWLLLDEPTHNLDRAAVEKMADIFRNEIPKLIDQVFLITHDEALEAAVTARLYKLERGGRKEDITRIVEE